MEDPTTLDTIMRWGAIVSGLLVILIVAVAGAVRAGRKRKINLEPKDEV